MGLSVKMAMLTCLGFISGMCWLVNRVARPVVEVGSPIADATDWKQAMGALRPVADAAAAFEHTAPVVASTSAARAAEDTLVVPAPGEADLPGGRETLPPLAAREEQVPAAAPDAAAVPRRELLVGQALKPAEPLVPVIDAASPMARSSEALVEGGDQALPLKRYRVEKGDTLVRISRREWQSDDPKLVEALIAANPQVRARRNRILVGEVLVIPTLAAARAEVAGFSKSKSDAPAAPAASAAAVAGAVMAKASGASGSSSAAVAWRGGKMERGKWYTVRANDSLVEIARRELKDASRWREIAQINGLRDANRILKGERLRLPANGS